MSSLSALVPCAQKHITGSGSGGLLFSGTPGRSHWVCGTHASVFYGVGIHVLRGSWQPAWLLWYDGRLYCLFYYSTPRPGAACDWLPRRDPLPFRPPISDACRLVVSPLLRSAAAATATVAECCLLLLTRLVTGPPSIHRRCARAHRLLVNPIQRNAL